MASRTSATRRTTPAGFTAIARFSTWSPDSKKIATFQQDQRNVGEMYLVHDQGRPSRAEARGSIRSSATASSTMIQRVIIDLSSDTPKTIRLQMPPDQHRSTLCDDIACNRPATDRRRVVSGRVASRVRVDVARSQARGPPRRRRRPRARFATCSRRRSRRSSSRASAARTGACCRRRTR